MQEERFRTHSLQDQRILRILRAALESVDPAALTLHNLGNIQLPSHRRSHLLAIGKAAEPMTQAAAGAIPDYHSGLVITKHRMGSPLPGRVVLMEAGHPVPDERSLAAGEAVLEFVSRLEPDDLLLCLLSGGASALATVPVPETTLQDLQTLTTALLASGASIDELNVLRRRLDRIKGGGLLRATRSKVLSLILSDVIGDRLDTIASGPTVASPAEADVALGILADRGIDVPDNVRRAVASVPASGHERSDGDVQNIIMGNNATARRAAALSARREGFHVEEFSSEVVGEARRAGEEFGARLVRLAAIGQRPACLMAGGETTVTLRVAGRGGRNQELALASVNALQGLQSCMLVALATDGNDGPTDAAGAVVTGETASRGAALGMSASDFLERHDAYPYFDSLNDLLKTGYTGTNVNDLIFLFAL